MMRWLDACWGRALAIVLAAFAAAASPGAARGQNPSFARVPVIVEYDVDPAWPAYPEDVSRHGWTSGIAVDQEDQVWFFKKGANPVQVYTADGQFVRSWGAGQFVDPHHLRIDHEGNIWLADFGQHIVQKYTPEGELLLTLGTKGEPGKDETHFDKPTDMAVTPEGDIFVTDGYGNRRVVHFDRDGRFVKAWGDYGSEAGQFVLPHAIAVDSEGKLYVADRNSGRIQVFDQQGQLLDVWSNLIMPWGLTINERDEVWVCGSSPHWWLRNEQYPEYKDQIFMRFSTDGRVRQVWTIPLGDIGTDKNNPETSRLAPGEAVGVHCIAQDSKGNLYVGDIYGERAQKFRPIATR